MLELDMPGSPEDSNRPALGASLAESDSYSLAGTAVEEGDRCASIYKSPKGPVASVAVLQYEHRVWAEV